MSFREPALVGRWLPSAAIVRPSGIQTGTPKTALGPPVTAVSCRVATSTTWIPWRLTRSASRRRLATNAIRVPSGDQAGSSSATGPSVRRVAAPDATSTSHRWPTWSYVKPVPLSM